MVHKPERWAVNAAGVAPEWQWAWRDLKFLAPLWEGSGQPASILPDAQISDVSGTPTWQISSGGYARRYDTTTERDIWSGVASDILNQVSELTVLVVCDPSALTSFRVAAAKGPALASNTYWMFYHDDVGNVSGRTHIMGFSVVGSTSSAVTRAEGSTNSGNGRVYVGRFRKDPLRCELWVDGLFDQADTTTSASSMDGSYTTATPITVGNSDNNSYPFDAPIEFVGVWERYLSDAEIRMLSADPFGLIRPRRLTPADTTNRGYAIRLFDDFTGSNGSPLNAEKWDASSGSGGDDPDIQNNAARFISTGNFVGGDRALAKGVKAADFNILFSATLNDTLAATVVWARHDGVWDSSNESSPDNSGYAMRFQNDLLRLMKSVGGSVTDVTTVYPTISVSTKYWYRFALEGSNIRAKVWQDGSSEPSTWNIDEELFDVVGEGFVGFAQFINSSSGTASTDIDDVTISQAVNASDPFRTKVFVP